MADRRKSLKVAAVQQMVTGELPRNAARAVELLSIAADRGADTAVWPVLAIWPWFLAEPVREKVEAMAWSRDRLEPMQKEAQRKKIAVVFPFLEREEGDGRVRLFNSVAILDSDGALRGVHRKAHLPDIAFWRERGLFDPGNALEVHDTSAGKIGVLNCWENLYPAAASRLVALDADWIAAPTSHAFANHHRWEAVMTATAFTNGIHVVRVNRVGRSEGLDFYGESQCFGPDGELVGQPMAAHDGIGLWTLDFDQRDRVRAEWGMAAARRDDLY